MRTRRKKWCRIASKSAVILALASALDKGSEHPLVKAIVAGAKARGIAAGDTAEFAAVTGMGVQGAVNARTAALGNAAMMPDPGLQQQQDRSPLPEWVVATTLRRSTRRYPGI